MGPTREENAALVRRFLEDAVADGDVAAADALVAEDLTDHNLVFEDDGEPAVALGWRVLAGAAVDIDVERVVASEDAVAVLATVTGVHEGSLAELAATGESFEIPYAWFCRIEDGRIGEIRSLPDGLGLLQQLEIDSKTDQRSDLDIENDEER